jgi:hypothetical protein
MVIDHDARGERFSDIYSHLLSQRIIFLGTPIDDEIANVTIAELLHLESEDPDKDISVYINCPGGSVYAGLAIYDTMQGPGFVCGQEVVTLHILRDRLAWFAGLPAASNSAPSDGSRLPTATGGRSFPHTRQRPFFRTLGSSPPRSSARPRRLLTRPFCSAVCSRTDHGVVDVWVTSQRRRADSGLTTRPWGVVSNDGKAQVRLEEHRCGCPDSGCWASARLARGEPSHGRVHRRHDLIDLLRPSPDVESGRRSAADWPDTAYDARHD